MDAEAWARRVYDAVDARDADAACAFLTDDVVLRYGNEEPWKGKENVLPALREFFQMIAGQRHHFHEVWSVDDAVIIQGDVDYTRLDQRMVTLPFVVVYRMVGELARKVDIMVDGTPVFAP